MKATIGVTPDAHKYRVFDCDTKKEIKHCFSADDESGEYWVYATNDDGTFRMSVADGKKIVDTEKRTGNIILMHENEMQDFIMHGADWIRNQREMQNQ